MKFSSIFSAIVLLAISVDSVPIPEPKGGGGGGGGGGGHGGHAGHSNGHGVSSGGGKSIGSSSSKGSVSSHPPPPYSYGGHTFSSSSRGYNMGGYGSFGSSHPQYSSGRSFEQTRSTYGSSSTIILLPYGYNPYGPYGFYGTFNPALSYWAVIESEQYPGYDAKYRRYNQNSGYYFAAQLNATVAPSGHNMSVIGTANSDTSNYHYTFNVSTSNAYPMADISFVASSNPDANPADFAYRVTTVGLFEYTDTNNNGVFDDGDVELMYTSFENAQWGSLVLSNKTVPTNLSQFYYETVTGATVNRNGTGPAFNVYATYYAANQQLNSTDAGIPIQPDSVVSKYFVSGYPRVSATSRIGYVQMITTTANAGILADTVNKTLDQIHQIKMNQTYGYSVGQLSEGRVEYPSSTNITDSLNLATINNITIANQIMNTADSYVWGQNMTVGKLFSKVILVTVGDDLTLSSQSYLDVNVLNANSGIKTAASNLTLLVIVVVTAINLI